MIASDHEATAQLDGELRRQAFKRAIDICEDSISRNDVHMTIQCAKCAKCTESARRAMCAKCAECAKCAKCNKDPQ